MSASATSSGAPWLAKRSCPGNAPCGVGESSDAGRWDASGVERLSGSVECARLSCRGSLVGFSKEAGRFAYPDAIHAIRQLSTKFGVVLDQFAIVYFVVEVLHPADNFTIIVVVVFAVVSDMPVALLSSLSPSHDVRGFLISEGGEAHGSSRLQGTQA